MTTHPKKRLRVITLLVLGLLAHIPVIVAQPITHVPDFLGEHEQKAQILILGTFHFKDKGLDSYKPQFDVDILSASRQREIEAIIQNLESFRPTRIAVEVRTNRQGHLDSLYSEYLAGTFELPSNEVYQLGFRLAKRLGLPRVFAVDVLGRSYFPDITDEEYDAKVQELDRPDLGIEEWNRRFGKLYSYDDSMKTVHSLSETLLYLNSADRLRKGHGHYLVDSFKLGSGDDYFGPDLATGWYNRNLRIFSNLQRLTRSPDERILLIIGAGHVPIIRHAVQSSPEHDLLEVADYLRTEN